MRQRRRSGPRLERPAGRSGPGLGNAIEFDGLNVEPNGASNDVVATAAAVTSGVQVLLARWGTDARDVDVTAILQTMAVKQGGNELFIPRSMNFNKAFGDPRPMRRKQLHIVALVCVSPRVLVPL